MAEKLPPTPEQEANKFIGGAFKDGEPYGGEMTEEEKAAQKADAKAQVEADKAARTKEKAHEAAESNEDEEEEGEEAYSDTEETGKEEGEEADSEEEEGEEADSEEEEGDEEEDDKRPKGKRSPQVRINKAVRKQRDAERRAAFAESQLAQMNARLTAIESGKPLTGAPGNGTSAPDDELKAPNASDFEYGELDERYRDAMVDYRVKKALREERASSAQSANQQAAQREAQEMLELAATFEDAGIDEFDDFEDVVIDGARRGKWPLPEAVGKLMLKSEIGHRIAYHLATHPKEARRIAQQDPLSQAATFGRLEAKFASKTDAQQMGTKTPAAKTSKAPPPPQVRAKGGKGKATVSAATTDFAAFERMASRQSG